MTVKSIRNDSADTNQVLRLDIGASRIGGVRVTTQGFLRIPANLTRTGVLTYRTSDGRTIRELRHPDDVMRADSLATLEAAPVTEAHPLPERLVTPDNVDRVQRGIQIGQIKNDGRLVQSDILVQNADTIKKVRTKALIEISPGYTCSIDPTPGEYHGERYDQKQTNIVYNHIALLPAGAGRSGSEIALRNDDAYSLTEEEPKQKAQDSADRGVLPMKTIRITLDGVTYEIQVADALAPTFEAAIANIQTQRSDSKAEIAKLQGQLAAASTQLTETQQRLDDATSPAALAKLVETRARVETKAKQMKPEIKCDGRDIIDIQKEALESRGFDRVTLDSKEAPYIEGAFESYQVAAPAATVPARLPGVTPVSVTLPEVRQDSAGPATSEEARELMKKRNREMCKIPA